MPRLHRHVSNVLNFKSAWKRISLLLKSPLFWVISFWGNVLIIFGAGAFYWLEKNSNPSLHNFLDSLSWSVAIVSTVGSSNIYPITAEGKILAIFMMMGGAIFLWSYMALFVGTLVSPELRSLEREVSEIQADFKSDQQLLLLIKN